MWVIKPLSLPQFSNVGNAQVTENRGSRLA